MTHESKYETSSVTVLVAKLVEIGKQVAVIENAINQMMLNRRELNLDLQHDLDNKADHCLSLIDDHMAQCELINIEIRKRIRQSSMTSLDREVSRTDLIHQKGGA